MIDVTAAIAVAAPCVSDTLHVSQACCVYLCSYSDVAIYLYMMRGAGSDMQTRTVQAPNGTSVVLPDSASHYSHVAPVLDLMRAVTPLSWARWITSGGKSGKYGPVSVAMYGNNKEW